MGSYTYYSLAHSLVTVLVTTTVAIFFYWLGHRDAQREWRHRLAIVESAWSGLVDQALEARRPPKPRKREFRQ